MGVAVAVAHEYGGSHVRRDVLRLQNRLFALRRLDELFGLRVDVQRYSDC